MSEQKSVTKVPEGETPYYTTRQRAPNEKGFVGYETVSKPLRVPDAEEAVGVGRSRAGV